MRTLSSLHILASTSSLPVDAVKTLRNQACKTVLCTLGSDQHPQFKVQVRKQLVRLIEAKLATQVSVEALPWVLFNLHLAVVALDISNTVRAASAQLTHYLGNLAHKKAA